ncbi:DUF7010 family protein [Pseudoalteromonas sp. T1lg65]|uniref:DUF7010 family protein n=1 Tax=Pseudoalteromonas sp. T1lg65 TaxID=2077101 RepID=UPI003F78E21F
MDSIAAAQKDMRDAYYNGAPGIACSGVAWVIAGLVALLSQPLHGMIALLVGGMFIFPASMLVCKLCGRSGAHNSHNPLAPLAIEGTIWMLFAFLVAVVLGLYELAYFFPAMLIIIAGRYLTFSTLYGQKSFYLLAAALIACAGLFSILKLPMFICALAGGGIELLFALIILQMSKKAGE